MPGIDVVTGINASVKTSMRLEEVFVLVKFLVEKINNQAEETRKIIKESINETVDENGGVSAPKMYSLLEALKVIRLLRIVKE